MTTDTTGYVRTIPNNYQLYSPLKDQEIRLLRVLRSSNDSDIPTCHIYRVNVTHEWRYSALSYCWGDLRDTKPINLGFCDEDLLEHDNEAHFNKKRPLYTFNATRTLHDALKAFQIGGFEGFLWADALCINQGDVEERSYQVTLMKDIYEGALVVEVWLGGDLAKDSEVLCPEDDLLTDSIIKNLDDETCLAEAEDWAKEEGHRVEMSRLTPQRFAGRLSADTLTRFVWVTLVRSGILPPGEDEQSVRRREEIFEILTGKDSQYLDAILLVVGHLLHQEVPADLVDRASVTNFFRRTDELCNNDWFRRIWVIQEVIYGRETFVRHSNVRISWFSMMNLVRIGSLARTAQWWKTGDLQPRFKNGEIVQRNTLSSLLLSDGGDNEMPSLWTQGLVPQIWPDWKPDTKYMYAMLPSLSPLEVIFQTGPFLATDPRDRLFGILSLIPSAASFLPDYTKPLAEISTSFTRWHAQTLKSWDVLSLCRPRDQRAWLVFQTYPSWAINFRHDYGVLHPFALRKYPENSNLAMFSAGISRGTKARLLLSKETQTEQAKDRITLVGCVVAEVVKVWQPMHSGISRLPHPSLWQREDDSPLNTKPPVNNSEPPNPLAGLISQLIPGGASWKPSPGNKVDTQRWEKAMAGHADKLLRSIWEVYSSSSGFTTRPSQFEPHIHTCTCKAYTTDDMDLPAFDSLPASHLQSSFQALIQGIALVTGWEAGDAAKLLSQTLRGSDSASQDNLSKFPFLCTNMASRISARGESVPNYSPSPFVHRVDNWSLFVTDDGRVGIGHAYTHVGDKVLVVHGGRAPYVIRQRVGKGLKKVPDVEVLKKGQEWELVGECFLEGRMHGEVVKDALYDDRLDADPVWGVKNEKPESGGGTRGFRRGGWRYRSSFRARPITLV